MRKQMEERLRSLTAEFKAGQEMLAELTTRESNLRLTLTRISGAIQVLEELLGQESDADGVAAVQPVAVTSA
jgi:prefoldin subunit 5